MSILNNRLWILDIDEVLAVMPELEQLSGKRVLITGASGLICSAIIDVLIRWNDTHANEDPDKAIRIFAAGRSEDKVNSIFSPYCEKEWFSYIRYEAEYIGKERGHIYDYIIHGAANAYPGRISKNPVETLTEGVVGIMNLMDYAIQLEKKPRILLISSSDVYGNKNTATPNKINEYGAIDILNPRNSYTIAKCASESLCVSYADEYGIDSVIVRPGHIYGPTASISDNRVSSAWAYDVARGKDIVMKSDGAQIRSYCYCLDCASAILTVLLKGETAKAYNISNPESVISIKELAEILAKTGGVELKMELPSDEDKKGFNPMRNSSLDATELVNLGWKGLFDAERGLEHTVEILKEN